MTAATKLATPAKPAAAAPAVEEEEATSNISTIEELEKKVNDLQYQRSEFIETTVKEIEHFEAEIAARHEALKKIGAAVESNGHAAPPVAATTKPGPKPGGGQGRGPRGGNEDTIPGGVEALCMKYPKGLTRPEITGLMMTEIQYKFSNTDAKAISDSVYTGGINKLTNKGVLVTVPGAKPKRYMHVKHAKGKSWFQAAPEEAPAAGE
jgi:hypothetical protein